MDNTSQRVLEDILAAYKDVTDGDDDLIRFLTALAEGRASYTTARRYAKRIGNMSTGVLKSFVEVMQQLPDSYDVVREAIKELAYEPAADFVVEVQKLVNESLGLGVKAQKAAFDLSKASGIAHNVAHAENADEAASALDEITTFAEGVVNDTIEANAKFQTDAGAPAKVRRVGGASCCEWCAALDGEYIYGQQPADFFKQHKRCKCSIEFVGGKKPKK